MADKMYRENSKGGKGNSPKYKMRGEGKGKDVPPTAMTGGAGKGTTKGGGEGYNQADKKGSFLAKYNQADKSGSFQAKYNM